MTWRIVLTVVEIGALVVILAIFLTIIAKQLNSISATLAKITFGVRAVETMCAVIGPAVERINGNLADTNQALIDAAVSAERLGS